MLLPGVLLPQCVAYERRRERGAAAHIHHHHHRQQQAPGEMLREGGADRACGWSPLPACVDGDAFVVRPQAWLHDRMPVILTTPEVRLHREPLPGRHGGVSAAAGRGRGCVGACGVILRPTGGMSGAGVGRGFNSPLVEALHTVRWLERPCQSGHTWLI
jgi:hypothetical protein